MSEKEQFVGWKLVETSEDGEDVLTAMELFGIRIKLQDHMGEPEDDRNIYFRAWKKIRRAAKVAFEREWGKSIVE